MARTMTFPQDVVEYLRLHHIITLSTSSFTGMPYANTVAYANDTEAMYFAALAGSTVARNIADNKHVSFTIDDYTMDWRKVRELQGVGACRSADLQEQACAAALFKRKFARTHVLPIGILHVVRPIEMHFVDYDYNVVTAKGERQQTPDVTSRTFTLGDAEAPVHAAVSTSLDRSTFATGEVIFRPGDPAGQYYVVVEGEVEVRGEGYGADQTVTRVGPGELFGDQATLKGQRGAFTAHAVTPTVLLAVQREAMRDLLLPRE
jgi:nitroimidazol reductase NimA-like FMN-containing flavoprotein (pyridoxamine 5'-phosphate oxidase superfamily)